MNTQNTKHVEMINQIQKEERVGINSKDSRGRQVNVTCGSCLDSNLSKPTGEKLLRQFRDLNMEMLQN